MGALTILDGEGVRIGGGLQVNGGLRLQEGANEYSGVATLVAGTVTVATTAVAANSRIITSRQATGGTVGHLSIGTITPGVSFVINASVNTDTSVIFWMIVTPAS